jgi:hypothetical protein
VLDANSAFVHFENVGDFYSYLKKNKNKDIVDFDSREFLSFMIKTEDGGYET